MNIRLRIRETFPGKYSSILDVQERIQNGHFINSKKKWFFSLLKQLYEQRIKIIEGFVHEYNTNKNYCSTVYL